ncbi:MAG TPA: copper chaperone PCu(A)C [Streptosporangiaceae bacterium]|nr:copper chaperone PCu(A)C [Streptosporangiaceae bacterium]
MTTAVTAAAVTTVAGCASPQVTTAPIKVASAYVMQSGGVGAVDAYLVIANSGSPDRLLAVRSSAGGIISLRVPRGRGAIAGHAVSAIPVPGHSVVRLDPTGPYVLITGSGPIRQGTDITLTLVFAHAGTLRVAAQVTDPQTSNAGYFGP